MLRMILAVFFSLVFSGCGPRYIDFFPYHDDGTIKPKVALLPVINSSECSLPWNVSSELTYGIRLKAMNHGEIYLLSEEETSSRLSQCKAFDLLGSDITFSRNFYNADYIVLLELMEHANAPYEECRLSPLFPADSRHYHLALQIKIRMIVIHVASCCVIHQEIMNSSQVIPMDCQNVNYQRHCWGTASYQNTPACQAHERLIHDLVSRIETVTLGR